MLEVERTIHGRGFPPGRRGNETEIAGLPILRTAEGLDCQGPVRLYRRIRSANVRPHGADPPRYAGRDHAAVAGEQDVLSQEERRYGCRGGGALRSEQQEQEKVTWRKRQVKSKVNGCA